MTGALWKVLASEENVYRLEDLGIVTILTKLLMENSTSLDDLQFNPVQTDILTHVVGAIAEVAKIPVFSLIPPPSRELNSHDLPFSREIRWNLFARQGIYGTIDTSDSILPKNKRKPPRIACQCEVFISSFLLLCTHKFITICKLNCDIKIFTTLFNCDIQCST